MKKIAHVTLFFILSTTSILHGMKKKRIHPEPTNEKLALHYEGKDILGEWPFESTITEITKKLNDIISENKRKWLKLEKTFYFKIFFSYNPSLYIGSFGNATLTIKSKPSTYERTRFDIAKKTIAHLESALRNARKTTCDRGSSEDSFLSDCLCAYPPYPFTVSRRGFYCKFFPIFIKSLENELIKLKNITIECKLNSE